jgi:serine/threonine-protein kinase RsbW
MYPSPQELSRDDPALRDQDGWCRKGIHLRAEISTILDDLARKMTEDGYSERDLFGVRLAMEEAIINAIKHGNQDDPAREVCIRYHVSRERVLAEIEDEGKGFDPDQVPDPLAPENIEKISGRGLLLMRAYMTFVQYNKRGNRVTLAKHRTTGQEPVAVDNVERQGMPV